MTESAVLEPREKKFVISQATLGEIVNELENLFDVEITISGNLKNNSLGKYSFKLDTDATLEDAIKETMRKARVKNHALFVDSEKRTIRIWIIEQSLESEKTLSPNQKDNTILSLTIAQMQKLDPYNESQEVPLLTREQMEKMDLYESESEPGKNKALTNQQMKLLDQYDDSRPKTLNQDQMRRLTPEDSRDANVEQKTLTKEQMLLLEPESMKP